MSHWRWLAVGQFVALLIVYLLLGVAKQPQQVVGDYNDLLMHFIGYAMAGLSINLALPQWRACTRALLLFGYSTGIELIQYTLPWRSFDLWDIGANSLGILLGISVGIVWGWGLGYRKLVNAER